jgi:phenylalanyl-tRNA synthetase beta chain
MANVKFPRKEFEKQVKITKEIEEKISLFGTPFESLSQDEVEIEIFPNRPDLYSLQGFMRSFLAFLGKKTGLKQYKLNKPEKNYEVKVDKAVNEVRPFTACSIVKGLKFDDEKIKEIIDIQEKLHSTLGRNRKKLAIGIYPLEHITLPITYTAKKPENIKFIPLESTKEMTGSQILRQHPTGREYSHLLKNKKTFPVFIDAKNEVLSMPPIINSKKTGKISNTTKDIFIECSGFDLNILKKSLNILVTMLADIGGKIYQMNLTGLKQTTPDLTPEKMKISIEDTNKLLGLELNKKQVKKLLEKMGYNFSVGDSEIQIPAYRVDILHPVDIYEDIAIAYGYDKFIPEIPQISTIGEEDKKEIKKRKISEILAGLSLIEISTHHLLTKQDNKKSREKSEIQVEDSKTDYKFLRSSLLPSILKVLSENLDSEYPQKIFEIGTIFKRDEQEETGIKETDKLAIALTPSNFTELKQILEYLAKMLSVEFKIQETENEKYIPGTVGKIMLNEKDIGILGEIHPSILKSWHLKMPLNYLEVDLTEVLS